MRLITSIALFACAISINSFAHTPQENNLWMKIQAKDKYERTAIYNTGVSIEGISEGYVYAFGAKSLLKDVEQVAVVETSFNLTAEHLNTLDFPQKDERYHNFRELNKAIDKLAKDGGDLVTVKTIGKSHQKRDIRAIVITVPNKVPAASALDEEIRPGIIFMGGHHAREHLSVEIPLMLAQHLVEKYNAGEKEVVELLENREVHIIPLVNPDGKEYDIETNDFGLFPINGAKATAKDPYKLWRKNRRKNKDGTYGVDLNRNYGFKWGTGGSSKTPSNDTYMGEKAFSEPESRAIRDYVVAHENLSILLTFHSFSELILYPWGHKYDSIAHSKDFNTHKKLAETMAQWNGYKPQQSSDLYIASGDTTDWSYGDQGLISFTFELDPKNGGNARRGFYPGEKAIDQAFNKNLKPALYLIEMADNPYKVLQPASQQLGMSTLSF